MKKILACIMILFTASGALFAQNSQKPVVAVDTFDAVSGIKSAQAAMLTRVFFITLGNKQKVTVVNRSVDKKFIREQKFQSGDYSDKQKTTDMEKALNANWLVLGTLENFEGKDILLTVEFYDTTFKYVGGKHTLITNAKDAYDQMDPLVDELLKTIENNMRSSSGDTSGKTPQKPSSTPISINPAFGIYGAPGTVYGTNGWQIASAGVLAGFNIKEIVNILANAEGGIGYEYKKAVGDSKEKYHLPYHYNVGGIFEICMAKYFSIGAGGGMAGVTNRAKIIKYNKDPLNEALRKEKEPSLSFPYIRGTIGYYGQGYRGLMIKAYYDYNLGKNEKDKKDEKNGYKVGLLFGYLW